MSTIEVTYSAAHYRVRAQRGPAHTHTCIDCGDPAHEWSYNYDDPGEMIEERTRGRMTLTMRYSLNPQAYSARCRGCHRTYDRSHAPVIEGTSQRCARHERHHALDQFAPGDWGVPGTSCVRQDGDN